MIKHNLLTPDFQKNLRSIISIAMGNIRKITFKVTLVFLFIQVFSTSPLFSQVNNKIKPLIDKDSSRLVEIFKDIHQNPEIAFTEVRTSGIIANELTRLGYQVLTGFGKTGLAGIFKNGAGPVVMYRADMDCNAVKEITNLPYASTKTMVNADGAEVPLMHACGHDAHVTWLLGIAKLMMSIKSQWKGTLVFLAQPAEEIIQGAQAMINDKMYEKGVPVPDYLFGMHTWPIPVGTIYNGKGERFAGSDQLDVTFFGIGGHGASPEVTKDPIVMASNAVMQYQTIISRNIAAQEAAVLTVGSFQAGNSNNVIPPSATLKLNLRWFNDKTRSILLDGIKNINTGIAVANNLPESLYPKINMKATVSPLINNDKMQTRINLSLQSILAPDNIISNTPAVMVSEDFQNLIGTNKTAYDYIFVGIANESFIAKAKAEGKKYPFYNHNGNYQVDLAAIPLGVLIGATSLLELLK